MISDSKDLLRLKIQQLRPEMSQESIIRILNFYTMLLAENEKQNLTRLTTPEDFYEGHLWDVLELLQLQWVQYPALDLGSGAGIPGLLAALLQPQRWILTESEQKKAEYLQRTVEHLELSSEVTVFPGRAETYLRTHTVGSVVVRAVGPVARVYNWLRNCSTWNNLILLKGPGWTREWEEFQQSTRAEELSVHQKHCYLVGEFKKERILVQLTRNVPRGTNTFQ